MASDIDRKQLWGRSGSRCAMCNVELTMIDGLDSIVGDEAHIRSRKERGPRFDRTYPPEKLDTYENLILLCKPHHKLIDDNWEVFPAQLLQSLKAKHEGRVRSALDPEQSDWVSGPALRPLTNGTEIADVVMGTSAYFLQHCHPVDGAEADLIGSFLEEVRDWADLAADVGLTGHVQAAMSLDIQMKELAERGMVVIGGRGRYRLVPDLVVPASVVTVVRPSDMEIDPVNLGV